MCYFSNTNLFKHNKSEIWNAYFEQSIHLKQNVIIIHTFWSVHIKNAHCIAYQNIHFVQSSSLIVLQLKVHILFKKRLLNFSKMNYKVTTFMISHVLQCSSMGFIYHSCFCCCFLLVLLWIIITHDFVALVFHFYKWLQKYSNSGFFSESISKSDPLILKFALNIFFF